MASATTQYLLTPFITALKIHISLEMKKALDEVGGFRTEHRGFVDIKVLYCEYFGKKGVSCVN